MIQKCNTQQIRAAITKDEKDRIYKLAKSKGMTFQGWMGQLIKSELAKEESR